MDNLDLNKNPLTNHSKNDKVKKVYDSGIFNLMVGTDKKKGELSSTHFLDKLSFLDGLVN